MTTLIHCPTDIAVLLLGFKQEDGVFLFPSESVEVPGISSKINPSLPINPQLMELVQTRCTMPGMMISIWQEFQEAIKLPTGEVGTLYAAKASGVPPNFSCPVRKLPDMLRHMPPDRNRVAYMKALQVFAGGLEEQTKALDLDEVRRHIRDLSPKSDS
jgi:hypothetical protein